MTAILTNAGDGRYQGSPCEYKDEAELHRLIEKNLHLLPLAGSPKLTLLGSEVTLGWGRLDILAVESTGRPVLIEVKLARNLESYRYVEQSELVMVSILNVRQEPRIAVYRPAFEHHTPNSLGRVEKAIAPKRVGHGNYIGEITSEVLDALTVAFHEASNC